MNSLHIRNASRLTVCLLALTLICGLLAACAPDKTPITNSTPSVPNAPDTPAGDRVPDATLPDDIRISFSVGSAGEAAHVHIIHGDHFDASGNRFFDAEFYLIYRFPTHSEHNCTELILELANQYEVSASADGVNYEVIASTTDKNQDGDKLILDLSAYRPSEGEGYVYVRLGDADTSDGWGGNLSKDAPVRYFSGVAAISAQAEERVQKGGNVMYRYDLAPGSESEAEFILRDGSVLADVGARPFHLCDATHDIVYLFRGTPGQLAYVTVDLSHEYLVELSADGEEYDEIVNYTEWGRWRENRPIDLSEYFAESKTVFLRISDYSPENGWGPQIRGMSYTVLTGGNARSASITVNDGWTVSVNGETDNYTAGEVIEAPTGASVIFEKTVTVPADYVTRRALSFAYIEGEAARTEITVNGSAAESIGKSGNAVTVALPEGKGENEEYVVRVSTVVGASGKSGLWRNVRLGMADAVGYPETSRVLGEVVRPFSYSEAPYGQVELNALAGNFLQSLYNAELGINSIDPASALHELYYVGDTARALIGVAYEETFSPIVRLEYALGMYEGLLKTMVPTSDTHCFLKYDARPKRVVRNGNALTWQNVQDVLEPFADMYLLPGGAAVADVELAYSRESEDRHYNGGAEAVSRANGAAVHAQINWYCGTSDRATVASLRSEGCDVWRMVLSFDGYSTVMNYVSIDGELAAAYTKGDQPVRLEPSSSYFVFDRLSWNSNGIAVVTDVVPRSAYMIPSENGDGYTALVLEFGADDEPRASTVKLNGIDTDLEFAYYVVDHLTDGFTYGCNGYDPSYLSDHSLGGLAAGAYLMKKYDVNGWERAVGLAAEALSGCEAAITERNYIPSVWQSAMAGCHFMVMAGEEPDKYRALASKWADRIVADQAPDGTYTWLDGRNPVATLIAYDITGNEKYLQSARRWIESVEYTAYGVIYRGRLYESPAFNGACDLILMNRFGYDDPLATVLALEREYVDDTGFFACSDINPYYLGYSLADLMEVGYAPDRLKTVLSLGQYVTYEADGSYTVTDHPSVYVREPLA